MGIYANYGRYTCEKYPGSMTKKDLEKDLKLFASWEVDYLKMDGCYSMPEEADIGYPETSRLLNATGRQIMFSCSWPFYHIFRGMKPNYTEIVKYCNLWRNYLDINDSWQSVT
jgi:alpha-N-acetylgalactosaminidase